MVARHDETYPLPGRFCPIRHPSGSSGLLLSRFAKAIRIAYVPASQSLVNHQGLHLFPRQQRISVLFRPYEFCCLAEK